MPDLPVGLLDVVRRHGEVVAAGDLEAIRADFRPDRFGQLIGSALLPDHLVGSEVVSLQVRDDGMADAHIRYTAASGQETVLRSRWIALEEGWRVQAVRNVPDTPPDLGRQGPSEDGVDLPFWEGLRDGVLRMQQCGDCRRWIWSPRVLCPHCHSWSLTWPEVEAVGTVYSWTRTWQPFDPGVRGHLPYVVVLVELPQAGGRRLLGALHGGEAGNPRIGQRVKGQIDQGGGEWSVLRWVLA